VTPAEAEVPGATPVRTEDAFDVVALDAWLRERVDGLGPAGEPRVMQFRGGASNLTYLLRYPQRDLVLRRPPPGRKAKSAHDMHREYDVQRLVRPHFAAVADMLAYAGAQNTPLDSELYVMTYVPGLILGRNFAPGAALAPERVRGLALHLVDTLAELNSLDAVAAGLGGLDKGQGYPRRQVEGWSRRYRDALTDDVPDGESVMGWLTERIPDDVAHTLIHGDWRFANFVLDPACLTVRAVLDWEMATIGDPLMDLGATLAYWVQADDDEAFHLFRMQPTDAPGMPGRAEVVEHYLARTGLRLPDVGWQFYEVFGLFRLAVIIQQIWYRFVAGHTTNPAFADYGNACAYLISRCERVMSGSGRS